MADYKTDRAVSDLYIPEIKAAVGSFLVDVAPDIEDTQRNTSGIAGRTMTPSYPASAFLRCSPHAGRT